MSWTIFEKKCQNNEMAINFSSKTIPNNADMPCDRRIYEFRDFKVENSQKLAQDNFEIFF